MKIKLPKVGPVKYLNVAVAAVNILSGYLTNKAEANARNLMKAELKEEIMKEILEEMTKARES